MTEKQKQLILKLLKIQEGYVEDYIYRLKHDYPIDEYAIARKYEELKEIRDTIRAFQSL